MNVWTILTAILLMRVPDLADVLALGRAERTVPCTWQYLSWHQSSPKIPVVLPLKGSKVRNLWNITTFDECCCDTMFQSAHGTRKYQIYMRSASMHYFLAMRIPIFRKGWWRTVLYINYTAIVFNHAKTPSKSYEAILAERCEYFLSLVKQTFISLLNFFGIYWMSEILSKTKNLNCTL